MDNDNNEPKHRFRGFELNPAPTKPLADAIGGFLVNFGVLEMQADAWLHSLSTDSLAAEELHKLNLSRRLQAVLRFLDVGRLAESISARPRMLWREALMLAELRNQVAHNPIVFGWRGEDHSKPPDFMGVVDKRKNVKRPPNSPNIITLSELTAAQNRSAEIAQELLSIAESIDKSGDWPPDDPMPRKDRPPSNTR
jgi:hypothetical protein